MSVSLPVRRYARVCMTWLLISVAAILSLAMLWVVMRLTWELVDVSGFKRYVHAQQASPTAQQQLTVVHRSQAGAGVAPSGPASSLTASLVEPPASTSAKTEDAKDLISNSTAAISAAIATVTLVITLGTTWFADKLRLLDKLRADLEQERASSQIAAAHLRALMDEVKQESKRDQTLRRANLAAKLELQGWVAQNAGLGTAPGRHAELCLHLDMIMSTDPEARYAAFGFLKTFLPEPEVAGGLVAIHHYCTLCHQAHGGQDDRHGIWCMLFDPIERAAYVERARSRSSGEWL